MKRLPLLLLVAGCGGSTPDVSLPLPSSGFQLSTDAFPVDAGTETQRCYFFAVPGNPGGPPIYVNRVEATQNIGSHHMNVFRVKTIVNLSGQPGDEVIDGECFKSGNWADWPLVTNLQTDALNDWTLPAGVAHKFQPGELLMLQSHYVNATTQKTPANGKAVVNFYQTDSSTVTAELGTVFATNQNIMPCPGDTNSTWEKSCTFTHNPVTIIGANGHFHSRGTRFEIGSWSADTKTAGAMFYTSTVWDDPPMVQNLDVQLAPGTLGAGIDWKCSYTVASDACGDPTKNCCFPFGPKVETNEHCNAFVYYYPKVADVVTCF
jgi:hypothetical protein